MTARPMTLRCLFILSLVGSVYCGLASAQSSGVMQSLQYESPDKLAAAAKAQGDASRGASIFFQPSMSCASCHATSDVGAMSLANVGPNLTRPNPLLTDTELINSILRPSQTIAKGFETTQVLTAEGQLVTGLMISEDDKAIKLLDPSTKKILELNLDEVEDLRQSPLSIMPEGVASQLASRQQFLDLVKYLMEIRDGGSARASKLQPAVLPGNEALPEYEAHIDHEGMIADLDKQALARGKAIYGRTCVNCHGTISEPGSLPTSLRFAEGKFKNGFDPYAMYQTITNGFGLMTPQRQLVPQQKYDVIHYIRETFLRQENASQYAMVDDAYLSKLPKGDTRGPEPILLEPWREMNYGPNFMATVEIGDDASNFAYKGHSIRLDHGPGGISQGEHRIVYEHDTMRVAAIWSGAGFIDWNGINFNGAHQVHPRIVGDVILANGNGPGWANPETGSFKDVREPGRDGRIYGPLPKSWIDYRGTYVHELDTVVHYRVGEAEIHEWPAIEQVGSQIVYKRSLKIDMAATDLTMRVADRPGSTLDVVQTTDHQLFVLSNCEKESAAMVFGVAGDVAGASFELVDDQVRLHLPARTTQRSFTLYAFRKTSSEDIEATTGALKLEQAEVDFTAIRSGGQPRWPESLITSINTQDSNGPFAVDTIEYPVNNPWSCRMRLTGVEFTADGEAAFVCDWDGNVWKVNGLHDTNVTWKRIASGLFQPLGIKIRNDEIFVSCRDQICRLHDFNADGETDYYESFNHDHQVTDHFHEFAMGLQCDSEGNFYYAKSARHALKALVPHHGTLLRVSYDGANTEILANGFRAANGVCLNDDGSFFVTDQEGHWNPKNRINWVRPGRFYGNMFGYHDVTDSSDSAMEPPMCWITNTFDRSPAELLWVKSDKWGPLNGSLLNLSYGYGKVYVVPHEIVGDQMQGGMCELPIPQFPTGTMRGRFHPGDGALYLCGMFSWAGTQEADGGFFRVRYTGKPMHVPRSLNCEGTTIRIGMSDAIDAASVTPEHFNLSRWNLQRSEKYGSQHLDTQTMPVKSAVWNEATSQITLEVPGLKPTWCMEIQMDIQGLDGATVHRVIHNTIHAMP